MPYRLLLTLLLVAGCQRPPDKVDDIHEFINKTRADADEIKQIQSRLPYTKIEFERSGCYGTCPVFKVILNVDGTATYEGKLFVDQIGEHTGTINAWDYARLCCLVDHLKLTKSASYSVDTVDLSGFSLRFTKRTGQVIEISDYGGQGPIELWALQQSIDNVTSNITWHLVSEANADEKTEKAE